MSQKKTKNSVSFEALSSLDAPVSFWKGIPFGLQHVMAMFVANLAPIFIVANAAKMTSAQSAAVIQSGLLVAGLGTCLQLYGAWLIGSRLPMVTGISFTYVAAAAAIDHMRDWALGSAGEWVTMGVPSDGSYGIPEGLLFGFPCTTKDGRWEIVQGLELSDFARATIAKSVAELESERAHVAALLG